GVLSATDTARIPAGGLALRARRARGAADLQGGRLQRDEGKLFIPRFDAARAVAAVALPRHHLWSRLRRRPQAHPGPDLRAVQGFPRAPLPSLQRQAVLLWR